MKPSTTACSGIQGPTPEAHQVADHQNLVIPLRIQDEQHRDHGPSSALRTRGLSILLAGLPVLTLTQAEKSSYLFLDPSHFLVPR